MDQGGSGEICPKNSAFWGENYGAGQNQEHVANKLLKEIIYEFIASKP